MPAGYFYSPTLWTNSPPISSISWNRRHSTKNIWLKVLDFTQDPRFLNSKFYPKGEVGRGWNDDNMSSWESKGPGPSLAATKKTQETACRPSIIFRDYEAPLSPTYNAFLLGSLKKHWGNIGMLLGGEMWATSTFNEGRHQPPAGSSSRNTGSQPRDLGTQRAVTSYLREVNWRVPTPGTHLFRPFIPWAPKTYMFRGFYGNTLVFR